MLFSIIIPTYNRADFLKEVLQTVLFQSYPFFEVIIVDDGGNDNTESVVKAFEDNRIRYFKKGNEERAAARNFGTMKSVGKYITFLDSDDILLPNHFENAKLFISRNNYPDWFHLPYAILDRGNVVFDTSVLTATNGEELLNGNFLSCMGVFLKRDIALQNLFNEDRDLSGSEDHELWMRIAARHELKVGKSLSSVLVQHDSRSVMEIIPSKLINRQNLFLKYVFGDSLTSKFIGENSKRVYCNSYSYVSLHLALTGKNKILSFSYFLRSVIIYPKFLFQRRASAIIKHLFFSY